MPRQRKPSNRDLPRNVREKGGYYSWRNPKDGVEYGLGRDRRRAIAEAIAANFKIEEASPRLTLVERLNGDESRTWEKWCDEFEKLLAERESKANTRRTRKSQLNRLRKSFPAKVAAASIDTLQCATILKKLKNEGKYRTAQAFRSFLIDCFDRMIAEGWRKDNPASVTDEISVKVKRARLSFEVFMRVYNATEIKWLKNAMALALVAGKDRDSVRNAQFSDFRESAWWNVRSKTGAHFVLPDSLRLEIFGMSLADVVRQCRSTGVVSPYLVHQTQRAKGARLGKPMHVDMITRKFSEEIAKLGIDWGDKNPPTFHEIRSLSARLHKEQGQVSPQDLLSHKDARSTGVYTDGRGEWVKVPVKSTSDGS